jgi:hypothetical protein
MTGPGYPRDVEVGGSNPPSPTAQVRSVLEAPPPTSRCVPAHGSVGVAGHAPSVPTSTREAQAASKVSATISSPRSREDLSAQFPVVHYAVPRWPPGAVGTGVPHADLRPRPPDPALAAIRRQQTPGAVTCSSHRARHPTRLRLPHDPGARSAPRAGTAGCGFPRTGAVPRLGGGPGLGWRSRLRWGLPTGGT